MSSESRTGMLGWELAYSGKVRDLYRSAARPGEVLMVASDRVSAFDHVLEPGIPGKGELLTRLSLWWFDKLDGVPNHLAGDGGAIPDAVAGRAMLVRTLDMFPVECVVRGYLVGSAWTEYQATGNICGIALPAGLEFGDRLPHPVFTPAFKAPMGEHDENITFERTVELVGPGAAETLRALSLDIYARAAAIAEERGLILADTKFEFGADTSTGLSGTADGTITLADEALTSDSSRYWDAAAWSRGERKESFDKQLVRDWLSANWDTSASSGHAGAPPRLPDDIVALTAARYRELIDRLTG